MIEVFSKGKIVKDFEKYLQGRTSKFMEWDSKSLDEFSISHHSSSISRRKESDKLSNFIEVLKNA